MKLTRLALVVLSMGVPPSFAASQQGAAYPHGTLTVDVSCRDCHTTEGWRPAKEPLDFDHGSVTGFLRDGEHGTLPCTSCHLDLDFSEPKLTEGVCTTCHVDVHRGRLSPDCRQCHNTTLFALVPGLDIHARTSFPLSGAHQQLTCESCHQNDIGGAFTSQATDCYACHSEDYAEAQFVDHVTAGFSTECQECHTTLAWPHSVSFDHTTYSGGYTLLGRHEEIRCSSCHNPGVPGSIFSPANQDDCIACHQSDYDSEHGGSEFPTTCITCHSNETWEDASFADHDAQFFPIFSGDHSGEWSGCETCHTIASDFRQFTCLPCHEHRQSKMDEEHDEESGYVYESTACYSCHPDGRSP